MSIQPGWKVCLSSTLLLLIFSAAVPALAAEPMIYRCGPAGSQWFSQIPCEESSEQVIVQDHRMFKETGVSDTAAADSTQAQASPDQQRQDSIGKAQAFIAQLEKQRNDQLAEIDRNIEELRFRSETANESDEAGGEAGEAANLMSDIQITRQSIVSEYDAMISAARQRIDPP